MSEILYEERAIDAAASIVAGTEGRTVVGYAAVFGKRAQIGAGIFEQIAAGAFSEIAEDDVRFTVEHDPGRLLARSTSGTLTLTEDRKGLAMRAALPDTSLGRDVRELMSRGDLNALSFRFKTPPARESWASLPGGKGELRTLEKLRLLDVSLTAFPAYADATAALRSRGDVHVFVPLAIRKRHEFNGLLLGRSEGNRGRMASRASAGD